MPLDKKHLLSLCARIATLKSKDLNEEDTRVILIDPMLLALGWNIFDLNEISRNCKTSSGGYVDYILKFNGRQIYLEAKPLRSKLEQKYQIQATNYAYEDNIDICVLTNGNRYQIFETFKRGTVSDRLLIDITLDDNKISLDKKVEYLNFISKENIKNGDLVNDVKNGNSQKQIIETDKLPEFKNLILALREKILAIGKDIREKFYHQYNAIGFRRNKEFILMNIKSESREIEFLLMFGEFKPKVEHFDKIQVETLPQIYMYGRMNFRAKVNQKEQIREIIDLIKQCYNLQLKWRT
ncbi:MAG: DUF5655 domain-containing protein [Candidatus Hermodarchaeota archaeon]